jgi:hypothetical protein
MILKIILSNGQETFVEGTEFSFTREYDNNKMYPERIMISYFDKTGYKLCSCDVFEKSETCGYPETEDSPLKNSMYLMNDNGKTIEKII